ncbi:MAG TPA: peptidoglycan recognition family protein [Candidatus Peribacterales bacterium]|nr:peptidoglycan recognition family protein [Candidatus Peribacterales bacterium]
MRILITLIVVAYLAGLPVATHARTSSSDIPTIVTRRGWGADESLGIVQDPEAELARTQNAIAKKETDLSSLSERDKQCVDAMKKYPDDFRVDRSVAEDGNGNELVWSRRYSEKIKLFVIHHTGEEDGSLLDTLTGPEQVRSIYYTHTMKNGWGDIGYHYLIDRDGIIYEGRAGGKKVIGAHVYCANTSTLGIAMIGNFQKHAPSDAQLTSVRKLLAHLAKEYDVNLKGKAEFHGKMYPTVVSHRDLASTICAGRRVEELLPEMRRTAASGDFDSILVPSIKRSSEKKSSEPRSLTPISSTKLTVLPRSTQSIRLRFQSGNKAVKAGESIASISRSDRTITIFQDQKRIATDLRAEHSIPAHNQMILTLTILPPRTPGKYSFTIDGMTYELTVR